MGDYSKRRVIWIVLDSVGIGDLPDSLEYGDEGCHTVYNTYKAGNGLDVPVLKRLGLFNIEGMKDLKKEKEVIGAYGRCMEISKGKDTTMGHFEMIGIYGKTPFPTYPNGFPDEITDEFIKRCNLPGILGNCTASGTEIIERLGEEHEKTKKPIVYTSADSVFQIAANEEIYSVDELMSMCRTAREILCGRHGVGRVIARPYIMENGKRVRTANRRDFSIVPDKENLLMYLKESGINVYAVGKIEDIFAGSGIYEAVHTKDNMDGMDKTIRYMDNIEKGLIFTNLVEFDSKWGHRRDAKGYRAGLEEADKRIGEVIENLREDDILVINADHGCDPTAKGTDHTREYVPLLVYGKKIKQGVNLGTRKTFADIGCTIGEYLGAEKKPAIGESFLERII